MVQIEMKLAHWTVHHGASALGMKRVMKMRRGNNNNPKPNSDATMHW